MDLDEVEVTTCFVNKLFNFFYGQEKMEEMEEIDR